MLELLKMLFSILFNPITLIVVGWLLISFFVDLIIYFRSTYYKETEASYFSSQNDIGRYGEYLTYNKLKSYEKQGAKFLFNTYLPHKNETTEIDVIMIAPQGIFVFESKNYSGWIFGHENNKIWYQTLPAGRKSHKENFFNPIMQNNTHINCLKALVDEKIPIYSIIVFSERCTLKKVITTNKDVKVINRRDIKHAISSLTTTQVLSQEDITEIYNKLHTYTQVDKSVKLRHIENINKLIEKENNFTENLHICNKCGGTMILRTAKKGKYKGMSFYGCENYPKCTNTETATDKLIGVIKKDYNDKETRNEQLEKLQDKANET